MNIIKNKKWLLTLICFSMIFALSVSTISYAGDGGREGGKEQSGGDEGGGVRERGEHKSDTGSAQYKDLDGVPDVVAGNVKVDYVVSGDVIVNGDTVHVENTTYHNEEQMGATKFLNTDFVDYVNGKNPDIVYDYTGNPCMEMYEHLARDTGIGTAEDWASGKITVGDVGLYGSLNMSISLTGNQAHIGDYVFSDGKIDLGYNLVNGQFVPSADLQALIDHAGMSIQNRDGKVILTEYSLGLYRGKSSFIDFIKDLLGKLNGKKDDDKDDKDDDKDDKDDDPDPDPKPDPDPPADDLDKYIVFTPTSKDWTNDKYKVVAKLVVPAPPKYGKKTGLTLHNCDGHCGCNSHYHSYCCNGGLDHGCEGHPHLDWTDPVTQQEYWGTEYCTGRNDSNCQPATSHWGRVITSPNCRHCGGSMSCNAGAHDHYQASPLGKTVYYDWSTTTNTPKGTAPGAEKIENGNNQITYYFASSAGEFTADALFTNIQPTDVKAIPEGWHVADFTARVKYPGNQNYYMTKPAAKKAHKTSGPYKFDNVNPNLTVVTTGYAEAGTKSYSGDATEAPGSWTKNSITFTITASDAHSGVDTAKSKVTVSTAGGQYLASADNFTTYSNSYGLKNGSPVSFTLDKSGIYNVEIFVEDRAKLGGAGDYYQPAGSTDDLKAQSFTVKYTVRIDKIAPALKYAYSKNEILANNKQNRFETSSERNPYFLVYTSDDEGWHGLVSGMASSKYLLSRSLLDGVEAETRGTSFSPATWTKIPIGDEFKERGKNVYLILCAKDKVGNASYTTTEAAGISDMKDSTANGEAAYVGPSDGFVADNKGIRACKAGNIFINRSNLYPITPDDPDQTNKKTPIEITRVYDVKWDKGSPKEVISWDNRARAENHAVYRNKVNDMIGLGYRVNFAYHLIGYGVDAGDKTTLYFKLYGKYGNEYKVLDLYLPDAGGNYSKVPESNTTYFQRTFTSNGAYDIDKMNAVLENEMGLNESKVFYENKDGKKIKDEVVCYFNYNIPANAKFKISGTNTLFQGSEVLVKANLVSRKHMDTTGVLTYTLSKDNLVPWNPVGTKNTFYGSAKTVDLGADGSRAEAFWYDADNTALIDIEGQKAH